MIYNENGIIINEDSLLSNYINHPYIIHEDFGEIIYYVKSKVIAVLQNIANSILNVIDWLANIPNRNKIKNNKAAILKTLNNQKDIIMKCELTEYLASDGYGKWIGNFKNACNEIKTDLSVDIEEVLHTLYEDNRKDWFLKKDGSINIKSIDMNKIVDTTISNKDVINQLRESYKSITEINKNLSKNEKINIEIINELQSYYYNAIKSLRTLSVHSIKLCLKALDGDISSYKFSDVEEVIDKEEEFVDEEKKNIEMVKKNPESIKDIDNPSEKVQMAAIRADYNVFKLIKNPTENVMYEAVKLHNLLIGDIYDPPERVQMVAVRNNPYAINSIKPTVCEKAKLKAVSLDYKVLEYIKDPSEKIQMAALQSNIDAFNYINNPCQRAVNYYNRHKDD